MQVIERTNLNDLPGGKRRDIQKIVKFCRLCQVNQETEKFLSFVGEPIIGEFNHVLQIDVLSLRHGGVLHDIDVGRRFRYEGFINKLDAVSAWKKLRKFRLVYMSAPLIITIKMRGQLLTPSSLNRVRNSLGQ